MKSSLRAGAWLFLALAAGCASDNARPPAAGAPAAAFDLGGRIAVRDHEHGFSGALRWEHRERNDQIWLSTPLGQSFAQLQSDADGATLTTADHEQYRAASIETLTHNAFGWRFPVAPLRHWVRGLPAPDLAEEGAERDGAGRLVRLVQDGWRVEFAYAQNAAVPARIEAGNGDAVIRVIIDRFDQPPP
ncbi:MAG TPA: lipoprotein insertase outer membrane protein LolB [Burkholderiales bacterium]|nr:lipoprotein insertase outer membrane protein LolB [Burkholderiales bacterium]